MKKSLGEKAFSSLILGNPKNRRWFWRKSYDFLSRRHNDVAVDFLNYGFAELDTETPARPEPNFLNADEVMSLRLYERLIGLESMEGLSVLEVGCGRGGGASSIAQLFKPMHVTAIDISEQNVKYCQQKYADPRVSFSVGDAENLRFSLDFDVVINLESSHCYGNRTRFFSEVFQSLKPGGVFLWGDLCEKSEVEALDQAMKGVGFSLMEGSDITSNVLLALDRRSAAHINRIASSLPRFLRAHFKTFAGVPGTDVYNKFRDGTLTYIIRRLAKPTGH